MTRFTEKRPARQEQPVAPPAATVIAKLEHLLCHDACPMRIDLPGKHSQAVRGAEIKIGDPA